MNSATSLLFSSSVAPTEKVGYIPPDVRIVHAWPASIW